MPAKNWKRDPANSRTLWDRLAQRLPAGLKGRQQTAQCARDGLFLFDRHGAEREIDVSCILGAIHPHKMADWPRVRGERYVGGHATRRKSSRAVRRERHPCGHRFKCRRAVGAGNDFHRFVGKEWGDFIDSVIDDVLKQLSRQLMDPMAIIGEQCLSKSAFQVVPVITLDVYWVAQLAFCNEFLQRQGGSFEVVPVIDCQSFDRLVARTRSGAGRRLHSTPAASQEKHGSQLQPTFCANAK